MSDHTKIEWATHTFNPWEGCTKISPGCANCYAEARNNRFSAGANWGKGKPRRRTTAATWGNPVKWNREAYKFGVGYGVSVGMQEMVRQRVFPSLCDWLDDEVPIEWLADFLQLIHDTPQLDWLLLTKRPDNFYRRLDAAGMSLIDYQRAPSPLMRWIANWLTGDRSPPRNVWVGVSVEDQRRVDERIWELLEIPAVIRFLSVEPLLNPVDLYCDAARWRLFGKDNLHWIIVGGESGPGARPCYLDWIRSIIQQCQRAGVPCFVKQLGSFAVGPDPRWPSGDATRTFSTTHPKGGDPAEWPEDLRVRQFPVPNYSITKPQLAKGP